MSIQYDEYLKEHIKCVKQAYNYMKSKMPQFFEFEGRENLKGWSIDKHDESKYSLEEYDAYDTWFYKNQSSGSKGAFNKAWLHHIHNNPHHWQHWVLIEDDPETVDGIKVDFGDNNRVTQITPIKMPDNYIMEMIADWWSFSWKSGNLFEIFDWYERHKATMKLHMETRNRVETVLNELKNTLGKDLKDHILG